MVTFLFLLLGAILGATGARTFMLIFWKLGLPIPMMPSYDLDQPLDPREDANFIGSAFGFITGLLSAGISYGVSYSLVSGLLGLAAAPFIVPAIYLALLVIGTVLLFLTTKLANFLTACSDAIVNMVPGKKKPKDEQK